MARAAYSTKLDTIFAGTHLEWQRRLLTVAITWPDDGAPANDAPFAYGDMVTVPAIPSPVTAYSAGTFSATTWTDVSALVHGSPRCSQSLGQACGEMTFMVAEGWEHGDLGDVFQENRVLLLQERWIGSGQDTDWFNVFWGLSDGYNEAWEAVHGYSVRARDAMKLASLHTLGRAEGVEVYQADLVQHGTAASHVQLTLVNTAEDAYEYGLPARTSGNPHPNWAPTPAPQLWCHNIANPVRLGVAGDAVQVVFGDGIVRVMKAWAAASPGSAGEEDYSLGLGVVGAPDIRGIVYRYAHAEQAGYGGTVETDLIEDAEIVASGAGYVEIAGNYTAWPAKLTLVLLDGSDERYPTTSLAVSGANTRINLANSSVTLATGRHIRYGEANRARDVAVRMLLQCGYQRDDSAEPLYASASAPVVGGASLDIVLPPLTYRDDERRSPMDALEDLRSEGWVPPNWIPRANASGQVTVGSVQQLAAAHADIVPVTRLLPTASINRLDRQVYTDVIARGLVRQVTDAARATGVTVTDANDLPTPSPTPDHTQSVSAAQLTRLVTPGAAYRVDDGTSPHRLFGWQMGSSNVDGRDTAAWVEQWIGRTLVQVSLASAQTLYAVELDLSNPWAWAWANGTPVADSLVPTTEAEFFAIMSGTQRNRNATFEPGAYAVQYYHAASATWRTLISYIKASPSEFPNKVRIEYEGFDQKAPVETQYLRVLVMEPCVLEWGRQRGTGPYNVLVGAYLSGIRAWTASELRGTAVLGQTSPFNTAGWLAVRKRLRPRTFVLPEPAPWAQSQTDVDELALLWLYEFARDLAPRQLIAVRPDIAPGDTISATLPGEASATEYLVDAVVRGEGNVVQLVAVDYTAPYG